MEAKKSIVLKISNLFAFHWKEKFIAVVIHKVSE